ncbi:Glycosyl transferases group 1 [Proteiniborus ethanoligenes]|uniref:Glycosyl transferases group 1 n=1 Tax=Proteiniborus ethanoligenes TaxID=415015 RepID=A0A1H3K2H9_9FIRM|nr:glycosyltransferase [Proteiniborus ethanoligenes]SDY45808.1 Glycosyl transferases group 1 [Proteiniborus ethanoligenes]
MKWIIKNPSPTDYRQNKWGDYHIGRCLTKYLTRLGEKVETDYYTDWYNKKKSDVVLVLRGKYPYKPNKNSSINIMWNFGHPEDVTKKEYEAYDIILIASKHYSSILKKQLNKPVFPFLLCTDHEEFYNKNTDLERKGFIFVGNTRGVKRDCVLWAIEYKLPLKVWGRGWEKFIDKKYIVDEYIANEKLVNLYSKAKVTLNNHWPDMLEYGFINNRVFDALACGLPVISDYSEELYNLFPKEILYYNNKKEFKKCIDEINLNYPSVIEKVNRASEIIINEYTYEKRATKLIQLVKNFKINN